MFFYFSRCISDENFIRLLFKVFKKPILTSDRTSPGNPLHYNKRYIKDMDSSPKPKRLKTIASLSCLSQLQFCGGNTLLHQFVLDNPGPNNKENSTHVDPQFMSDVPANVANALNDDGYSALHLAVMKNNSRMVKKLLFSIPNIDVNARSHLESKNDYKSHACKESPALHIAAEIGDLSIVQELLDKGAKVNIANTDDEEPLFVAVRSEHLDVVELLVNRDADVNSEGLYSTPLCNAARTGNFDIVKFLVSRGADVNTPIFAFKTTPLHCAVLSGSLEIVEFLVSKGANIHAESEENQTPLHYALSNRNSEIFKFLISAGADWRSTDDENGKTLLHYAARDGSLEIVEFLTELGADVNARDGTGKTPLHDAVGSNLKTVKFLISKGADWHATDENGKTTLHFAAREGNLEIVSFWIDQGASVDAVDGVGRTPLHDTVSSFYRSNLEILEFLISKGANMHATDKDGRTPLHCAVVGEFTALLLDQGADLDAADASRWTPLHVVGYEGHVDVVKVLVDRGANVNAENKDGKTPLDLARENRSFFWKSCIKVLRNAK